MIGAVKKPGRRDLFTHSPTLLPWFLLNWPGDEDSGTGKASLKASPLDQSGRGSGGGKEAAVPDCL